MTITRPSGGIAALDEINLTVPDPTSLALLSLTGLLADLRRQSAY